MDDFPQKLGLQSQWPAWPVASLSDDLLPFIERHHRAGRRLALATLIAIEGSSPRPLGSEMAIADDGSFCGYVSGGCIEASVVAETPAVLRDDRPKRLVYGRGSPFFDIVLACGGRIEVLLRPLSDPDGYLQTLRTARHTRRPVTAVSNLHEAGFRYSDGDEATGRTVIDGVEVFAKRHLPATRVCIVGAGVEALALARLATTFDLEVTLIRPKGPIDAPIQAGNFRYERQSVSQFLESRPLDAWSALYALSHEQDIDTEALMLALPSPAFVVGALGSRGRAKLLRERLRAEGLDDASIERLQAPAGLPIR